MVFLALGTLATTARADPLPELSLLWEADPDCPDRAWFEARLRDRVASEIEKQPPRPLEVSAYLRRTPSGFSLELSTEQAGERGERHLTATACAELAEAAVLVVALAITEESSAPASPTDAPPAPPTDAAPPTEEAAVITGPARRHMLTLRADALLDVGSLPKLGFGPQLSVGYLGPNLRVEVAGFWLPAQRTERTGRGNVSVSAWGLRPTACARLWGTTLRVDACAGLELGRMVGEGTDLNQERQRAWLNRAIVAGLRASLAMDRLAAVLEPGLFVPLGRPRFVSDAEADGSTRSLHTPAPVSFRATFGVELRF